ncbi:uncharacterized protein LOC119692240 [Plutella xylostella]|uniref:uncharacterized protein LOC119692240 n=1 Tax=Plutella xylostella TaxID=51655 RepID=UPI002032DC3E|nr:uncharacterized protein LOC119692240 [Plutella xylostella]
MAYAAIIATQLFTAMLSLFLFYGIYKESASFVVPWVVGGVAGAALEVLATVYSNVLRDHVNKRFDAACRAEVAFLLPRLVLQCVCIWWVLRMYHLLRAGVTWSRPAAIEL